VFSHVKNPIYSIFLSSSPSKELPHEVSGVAMKQQLKNLTNPLSKLGKYVQQVKSPIAEGIAIMDAKVNLN
jgi:hypothetical protein